MLNIFNVTFDVVTMQILRGRFFDTNQKFALVFTSRSNNL
jgi:hypothetical protein